MVLNTKEEEILKLMVAEMTASANLNDVREKAQVNETPLREAHQAARLALKNKVNEIALSIAK